MTRAFHTSAATRRSMNEHAEARRNGILLDLCKQWVKDGSPGEAAKYAELLAHRVRHQNKELRARPTRHQVAVDATVFALRAALKVPYLQERACQK